MPTAALSAQLASLSSFHIFAKLAFPANYSACQQLPQNLPPWLLSPWPHCNFCSYFFLNRLLNHFVNPVSSACRICKRIGWPKKNGVPLDLQELRYHHGGKAGALPLLKLSAVSCSKRQSSNCSATVMRTYCPPKVAPLSVYNKNA